MEDPTKNKSNDRDIWDLFNIDVNLCEQVFQPNLQYIYTK